MKKITSYPGSRVLERDSSRFKTVTELSAEFFTGTIIDPPIGSYRDRCINEWQELVSTVAEAGFVLDAVVQPLLDEGEELTSWYHILDAAALVLKEIIHDSENVWDGDWTRFENACRDILKHDISDGWFD